MEKINIENCLDEILAWLKLIFALKRILFGWKDTRLMQ
jgi:hypothetical protein